MAVKFQTNIPITVHFPYGDFKEVNGQYGPQFLYTVHLEGGQRDWLYATPALHEKLQAAGVGPGALFTITKIEGEGNRKSWVVEPDDPPAQDRQTSPDSARTEAQVPSANGRHEGRQAPTPPNFGDLALLMAHSLHEAVRMWQALDEEGLHYTSEDVRAVGISLFLEGCRKGLLPQPIEEEEKLPF
jgi:hypothetical protein